MADGERCQDRRPRSGPVAPGRGLPVEPVDVPLGCSGWPRGGAALGPRERLPVARLHPESGGRGARVHGRLPGLRLGRRSGRYFSDQSTQQVGLRRPPLLPSAHLVEPPVLTMAFPFLTMTSIDPPLEARLAAVDLGPEEDRRRRVRRLPPASSSRIPLSSPPSPPPVECFRRVNSGGECGAPWGKGGRNSRRQG